jgi:hypothetical protein
MEDLTMLSYFGWIEVIALTVIALVLFACFWGTLTRWELSTRIGGDRSHAHGVGLIKERLHPVSLASRPAVGPVLVHNGAARLEPPTARWLWNDITLLIDQGKLSTPAAAFLRGRADDDATLARIYRVHVFEPTQFYASEEESIIAACEYVARQCGSGSGVSAQGYGTGRAAARAVP